MSKTGNSVKPVKMTSIDAIFNLAGRLKALEQSSSVQFKALEKKIGEHENTFTEGAPDMDSITEMFKVLSTKITEQSERLSVVESKNDIVPKKKKGGTVKLNDLETETVGITF
jgi:hypothetical protein